MMPQVIGPRAKISAFIWWRPCRAPCCDTTRRWWCFSGLQAPSGSHVKHWCLWLHCKRFDRVQTPSQQGKQTNTEQHVSTRAIHKSIVAKVRWGVCITVPVTNS